jgi:hypothetical protein
VKWEWNPGEAKKQSEILQFDAYPEEFSMSSCFVRAVRCLAFACLLFAMATKAQPVVSVAKLSESSNFLSVNLTIRNNSSETLRNLHCGWYVSNASSFDLVPELDYSSVSGVQKSVVTKNGVAELGYDLPGVDFLPNQIVHLNIRMHRSDWQNFDYKNGSYLGLVDGVDAINDKVALTWGVSPSSAGQSPSPIPGKSVDYSIQSRVMQISPNTVGIEARIKNTGNLPLNGLGIEWTPSFCTNLTDMTVDVDYTTVRALDAKVVKANSGIQNVKFDLSQDVIASGEERIIQFRLHSINWMPVDFQKATACFSQSALVDIESRAVISLLSDRPDSSALMTIAKSDANHDSISIHYDFSSWAGFSGRKDVPLMVSSSAVAGMPTVRLVDNNRLPPPPFDSTTWTGQIFDVHTTILPGKRIEIAIPLPDSLIGITSWRAVQVMHYADGKWQKERITKVANGAIYVAVSSLSALTYGVNPLMNTDSRFDPTTGWDWTDLDWYSSYSNWSLNDPFRVGNFYGIDLSSDFCSPDDGWELYIRRLFNGDSKPLDADPVTGYPNQNDPKLYRPNSAVSDATGLLPFPYFVLYNSKTGVFRNFIFMNPTMNPTAQSQYVNAKVRIGNFDGTPVKKLGGDGVAKAANLGLFAHLGGSDQSTYTPLSQIGQIDLPLSIGLSGQSFVNWKWVIFEAPTFYDPNISSELNLGGPIYYRLETTLTHQMMIDLSGNISGNLNQQMPGIKPSSVNSMILNGAMVSAAMSNVGGAISEAKALSVSITDKVTSAAALLEETTKFENQALYEAPSSSEDKSLIHYGTDVVANLSTTLLGTAFGPVGGVGAAVLNLAANGIFTQKSSSPVPMDFKLNASIDLSGKIVDVSSAWFGVSELSGTPSHYVGGKAADKNADIPIFAKVNGNPALGAFAIARNPRMTIVVARADNNSVPKWYPLVEDINPLIVLNSFANLRVHSIYYSVGYDTVPAVTLMNANGNWAASICAGASDVCTYSPSVSPIYFPAGQRLDAYLEFQGAGDFQTQEETNSSPELPLSFSKDANIQWKYLDEYYDSKYNIRTEPENSGDCYTQSLCIRSYYSYSFVRKNTKAFGWDKYLGELRLKLYVTLEDKTTGKLYSTKLTVIPDVDIFDSGEPSSFDKSLRSAAKNGVWIPSELNVR